jgi:hypothetical protein
MRYLHSKETEYFLTPSLLAHAFLATERCEAAKTMKLDRKV